MVVMGVLVNAVHEIPASAASGIENNDIEAHCSCVLSITALLARAALRSCRCLLPVCEIPLPSSGAR